MDRPTHQDDFFFLDNDLVDLLHDLRLHSWAPFHLLLFVFLILLGTAAATTTTTRCPAELRKRAHNMGGRG